MKLNLGCGADYRPGYVNVDFRQDIRTDLCVDLSVFPWPFEDGSAEEVLLLDFLEHFPYRQTAQILLECRRILAPGGFVEIQVPDADHTMRALCQVGVYLCNACGQDMSDEERDSCEKCGQTKDSISEAAMGRLYGGQDYVGNFHHVCFTERSLWLKAEAAGLRLLLNRNTEHYWRNWTLCMRFGPGDLW